MQAITQNSLTPRLCLRVAGIGALAAGAAVWYGGSTAVVVGAVALAALALVAYAVSLAKQRPVEKKPFLTPASINDVNECNNGKIYWKWKLLNTDILVEEHLVEKPGTQYSTLGFALGDRLSAEALSLDTQNIQFFKKILASSSKNPFLQKANSQTHFVLPIVPFGPRLKTDAVYDTFVIVYKAVNEFLAEGGKADKISLFIPDGSELVSVEYIAGMRKRLRQELKPALMSGIFDGGGPSRL